MSDTELEAACLFIATKGDIYAPVPVPYYILIGLISYAISTPTNDSSIKYRDILIKGAEQAIIDIYYDLRKND